MTAVAAAGPLRRARASSGERVRGFAREAARRRRLDQRRLLRPLAGGRSTTSRATTTVWEQEPMRAAGARRAARRLPPRRLLAARWTRCATSNHLEELWSTGRRRRGRRGELEPAPSGAAGACSSPATPASRALAGALAAELGAEVTGFSDGVPTEPVAVRAGRASASGMTAIDGDMRDSAAVARGGRRRSAPRSCSTWRRSRSCGARYATRARPTRPTSWAP